MRHGFARQQSLLVIVPKQLVQKVQRLRRNVPLVFGRDKLVPRLARVPAQYLIVMFVEFDLVLFEIGEQFIRSQYFGDFHQLVVIVVPVKEGFLAENLYCK